MEGESGEDVEQRPTSFRSTARGLAARQVAVSQLPSRQLPHNTLRLRRNNSEHNALLDEADADDPDSAARQTDVIVRELEQNQLLMEDNPLSEELRRAALRELPQGLATKRRVRARLSASVRQRPRRPLPLHKLLKYRLTFAWRRSGERMRDAVFSYAPWHSALHNIEGHFGSAAGAYFRALRRLAALDAALAVLLLALVVLPRVYQPAVAAGAEQKLDEVHTTRYVWNIITGKGFVEDSVMFYGHYDSGRVRGGGYDMAFAYFFTNVAALLAVFAFLCYGTAYSYRRNFIDAAGALSHVFASKVFCGWDFQVTDPRAAALHAASIYNELKELLSEQNKKLVSPSFCVRLGQCLTNIVITALVLGCIGGVLFGLWALLAWDRWELRLSLLLTAVVTVCPALFHAVVRLEYYSARTALYVTLARTWLLDTGVLLLLLLYWARSGAQCWETRFGQEAYRLVLLDALVSLFVLPAVEFIRAFLYKLHPQGKAPEFNIAYNSLTLIYNQAVLWMGMLFSPLLATVVALKFLLLFYVKKACLMHACQPARKAWRAAQTQTVLYMLVTLSLFTTLFAIGSLFLSMSSTECGPFRDYEYVYMVLSEGVLGVSQRPALQAALAWLARPAVLAFMLLLLGVCVFYMRARARAQAGAVRVLRHMLALQARDKDFLLAAIANVSNGEWLYSPKDEEGRSSHTWRYLHEVRKPSNSSFHFDASRLSRSFGERPKPAHENRPSSHYAERSNFNDGDTDSSFSWQGSGDINTVESKGN